MSSSTDTSAIYLSGVGVGDHTAARGAAASVVPKSECCVVIASSNIMVLLRTLVTSEELLLPYPKIYARSTVLSKDRDILAYHFPRLTHRSPYSHSPAIGEPNQDASGSRPAAKLKEKQASKASKPEARARTSYICPAGSRQGRSLEAASAELRGGGLRARGREREA